MSKKLFKNYLCLRKLELWPFTKDIRRLGKLRRKWIKKLKHFKDRIWSLMHPFLKMLPILSKAKRKSLKINSRISKLTWHLKKLRKLRIIWVLENTPITGSKSWPMLSSLTRWLAPMINLFWKQLRTSQLLTNKALRISRLFSISLKMR